MIYGLNLQKVFVTTLNTDDYLPGVLALERTIRDKCVHRLYVLVSHGLAEASYAALRRRNIAFGFADDISIDPTLSGQIEQSYSHWMNTLFKLRVFELTQFDKIVFIDSDIMVLEPIDDLFDRPDMSAVVAGGSYPGNKSWRDLNSGVLVIEPRAGIVERLIDTIPAVAAKKRNFGDQDVLAAYFTSWPHDESLHLSERYNVFFDHYQYYLRRGGVKALHFNGKMKPWMMGRRYLLRQLFRCAAIGNARGIGMLLRYRRYLREVCNYG